MERVSTKYLIPSHSYKQPISASGRASRSNWKIVGKMPCWFNTREGSSGVLDPHSVYPCSSGPAPMNIEAQLMALDEGSAERFFNV